MYLVIYLKNSKQLRPILLLLYGKQRLRDTSTQFKEAVSLDFNSVYSSKEKIPGLLIRMYLQQLNRASF